MLPAQVVWTYSGVRPLYDDGASAAQEATRDYVLKLDAEPDDQAASPLLSVFGGKITTYRRLAEAALAKLAPHLPRRLPGAGPAGPRRGRLPGGDFARTGLRSPGERSSQTRHPWLPDATATPPGARLRHRRRGSLIGDATVDGGSRRALWRRSHPGRAALSRHGHEWATTAADVVWRRSKLGLRLSPAEIARIDEAMARQTHCGLIRSPG